MHQEETVIFVFESNMSGRHVEGLALVARRKYGAEYGHGMGRHGSSFAIPTKDEQFKTLTLEVIRGHVDTFILFALNNPEMVFQVTAVGTGLAGYSHAEMAPMFSTAPSNCKLPEEWFVLLPERG